jgi:hypothetical protein
VNNNFLEIINFEIKAIQLKALLDEIDDLHNMLDFHPRAYKLMRKRKPFLVVAIDEPYAKDVYDLIRDHEMDKGTWTIEDQNYYVDFIEIWKTEVKP